MNYWRSLIPVLAAIGAVAAFSEHTSIDARQECLDRWERDSSISCPESNCFQRLASDQTRRVKEREKTQRSRIDFLGQRNARQERSEIRRNFDAPVESTEDVFSRIYQQQSREQSQHRHRSSFIRRQLNSRDERRSRRSENSFSDGYRLLTLYRDFRRIEKIRTRSRADDRFEPRILPVSELSVRLRASRLLHEDNLLSGKRNSEKSLRTSFGNHGARHFERNPRHKLSLSRHLDSHRSETIFKMRFINAREAKSTARKELNARSTEQHQELTERNKENQQQNIFRRDLDNSEYQMQVSAETYVEVRDRTSHDHIARRNQSIRSVNADRRNLRFDANSRHTETSNEDIELIRERRQISERARDRHNILKISERNSLVRQSHENIREPSERFDKVNGRDSARTNIRYRRDTLQSQRSESNNVLKARMRPSIVENYFENNLLMITEWKTLAFYYFQGIYLCAVLYNLIGGFGKSAKKNKSIFDVRSTHPGKTIKVD